MWVVYLQAALVSYNKSHELVCEILSASEILHMDIESNLG